MRHLLLLLTLLTAIVQAQAQLTASGVFTSAPPDIFPLLDKNTRLDMVDYYNSGLSTPSANRMDGHSVITELTPTSMSIKLSESSSAQIAILPADKDSVIAVVTTVATPGLDSTLKFYDRDWHPIKSDRHFKSPVWDDWITDGHDSSEVTAYAPFMLASYFINTAEGTLVISNNLSTFLDEDTYSMVSPALRSVITYRWNGKRFNMQPD